MPKKFPAEFKRDVVTVARRGDLSVAEVAVDFGIAEETVRRWKRQADIDAGIKDGLTSTERRRSSSCDATSVGWRWRTRSSGVPPPTSPRTPSQNEVPAGPGAGRPGLPGAAGLRGARLFAQAFSKWCPDPVSQRDYDDAHSDDPEFGTASSPPSSPAPATASVSGGSGDCAPSTRSGRRPRRRAERAQGSTPDRRCTRSSCSGTSPLPRRIWCG